MSSIDEDSLMRETEGYMGSISLSGESTDGEPCPLSIFVNQSQSVDERCSEERVKLIHLVDPVERSWKKLLSEKNFRPSCLWSCMELTTEGTPFPRFKNLIAYAWVRYSFDLLYGIQFLTPISKVELKFTLESMSNLKVKIPNTKEVLKKIKEKATASAQNRKQPSMAAIFASPQGKEKYSLKLAKLNKKKAEHKIQAKMKGLENKVAELQANEDRLWTEHKAELDNLVEHVSVLIEKVETIADDAVVKTKTELMKEYKEGKFDQRRPDETIVTLEKLKALAAAEETKVEAPVRDRSLVLSKM
ncbi:hypothetical protein ACOSQ2_021228 [Xanthoceras sorbifolium]